jgi:hypothetical protein
MERSLGHLGPPRCFRPLLRVLIASLVMGIVVLLVSNLSSALSGPALFLRVVGAIVLGAAAYVLTAAFLARRGLRGRAEEPAS